MARERTRLIAGWGLVGLSVALGAAIVASRWHYVQYNRSTVDATGFHTCDMTGSGGVFGIEWMHDPATDLPDFESWSKFIINPQQPYPELEWWFAEFEVGAPWRGVLDLYQPWATKPGVTYRQFRVLIWPIAALFLAGGASLLFSARRARRRLAAGGCIRCGYDLKGLGAAAGCPECGDSFRVRSASEGKAGRV